MGMGNSTSGSGLPKWGIPPSSKTTGAIHTERPSRPVPEIRLPWQIIQTLPSTAVEKEGSPASLYFRSEWSSTCP